VFWCYLGSAEKLLSILPSDVLLDAPPHLDLGGIRVRGAPAWWLWGAAHIAFLIGARNRITVLASWLWAYLTFRRGSRLITGSGL
jgi:hypothetical protein